MRSLCKVYLLVTLIVCSTAVRASDPPTVVSVSDQGALRIVQVSFGGTTADTLYRALRLKGEATPTESVSKTFHSKDGAVRFECDYDSAHGTACRFTGRLRDSSTKPGPTTLAVDTDSIGWKLEGKKEGANLYDLLDLPKVPGSGDVFWGTGFQKRLSTPDKRFVLMAQRVGDALSFWVINPAPSADDTATEFRTSFDDRLDMMGISLSPADAKRFESDFHPAYEKPIHDKDWRSEDHHTELHTIIACHYTGEPATMGCGFILDGLSVQRNYLQKKILLKDAKSVSLYASLTFPRRWAKMGEPLDDS